jgi:hypothetical protein
MKTYQDNLINPLNKRNQKQSWIMLKLTAIFLFSNRSFNATPLKRPTQIKSNK